MHRPLLAKLAHGIESRHIAGARDATTNIGSVTFDDATTLTGAVEIAANNDGADILFRSTIATGGNARTLHAGPSGDITLAGFVTGGGSLTVRDGFDESFHRLDLRSINIQEATNSVHFNGVVSTTGYINVTSPDLKKENPKVFAIPMSSFVGLLAKRGQQEVGEIRVFPTPSTLKAIQVLRSAAKKQCQTVSLTAVAEDLAC